MHKLARIVSDASNFFFAPAFHSIATSFTAAAVTTIIARFPNQWNKTKIITFTQIFGSRIVAEEFIVSLPRFDIRWQETGIPEAKQTTRFLLQPTGVEDDLRGDVPGIVSTNDITGASYVLDAFGPYTAGKPNLKADGGMYIRNTRSPVIAFGLQTNPHCDQFLNLLNEHRIRSVYTAPNRLTENNRFFKNAAKISEIQDVSIQAEPQSSQTWKRKFKVHIKPSRPGADSLTCVGDGVDYHYGFIIIYRPENDPDNRHVYIAGVGHGGTSGSAYLLSQKWEELAEFFPKNEDQGAVGIFVICLTRLEGQSGQPQDSYRAVDHDTEIANVFRLESKSGN
jgi:hypothetical protein